jgi:uncharacterized alkaline shock family protein YloU
MAVDGQKDIAGSLQVTDDVIADLVGYAAQECYGVVGMSAPNLTDGIAKLLPAQSLRRGVKVTDGDDGVRVDLYVVIEYGNNLATVSKNLIDTVTYMLEDYAGLQVADVMVHVQGVHVPKERR